MTTMSLDSGECLLPERRRRWLLAGTILAVLLILGLESAAGAPTGPDGESILALQVYTPENERQASACCLPDGNCVDVHHSACVNQGGDPQGPNTTCETLPQACRPLKWSQPPVFPSNPANTYTGWNDYSVWTQTDPPSVIVADDWVSDGVTISDIRWWGSYIGWNNMFPPTERPDHFHIHMWTDVPGGPGQPQLFSHPGQVIWEVIRGMSDLNETFVGWDHNPATNQWEAIYYYTLTLTWPEEFNPQPGIYWISIAGCYEPGPIAGPYPWGWKNRPRHPNSPAPDDAVRIFEPWNPIVGSQWVMGEPIFWPDTAHSWDMAFELKTAYGLCLQKVYQPPDETSNGLDVESTSPFVLAEDYLCTVPGPLCQIDIWGSWLHDILPLGDANNVTFTLSIHADVPADQNPDGPWSKPGALLWTRTYNPGEFSAMPWSGGTFEWWMTPPHGLEPNADSQIWSYGFPFPWGDPANFVQQGTVENPVIYWIDVKAMPWDPMTRFGWKTSTEHWNDDAVWHFGELPYFWQELRYPLGHPQTGQSIDLAFDFWVAIEPGSVIWSQKPVAYDPPDDCFWGWDEHSHYACPGCRIVADDWLCTDERPITDIHWWGSYMGWSSDTPPADGPMGFHIGIWTDVPADPPSDETCCYCWNPPGILPPPTCSPNPPDPATCWQWGGGQYQQCTYYANSRCMGDHCEAIQPPFSHPGTMIWEWFVPRAALNERAVGCDFHPSAIGSDSCFKYDFELPLSQWFYQNPAGASTIYWVSISADYQSIPPLFMWGWKTRPHVFADDAVTILEPNPPLIGSEFISGTPIERPPGTSWDMAFTLTSQAPEACCINQPSGPFCMDLPPDQCVVQGVPQGPGTACSPLERIACCLPDGSCADVDPQCCDDLGGIPSPYAAMCMGDNDGNGIDDACEPPCHPEPDGSACRPTICPNPTDTCVPTSVLCVGPGICRITECQCQDGSLCHVDLDVNQQPICVGDCPPDEVCNQVATTEPSQAILYRCVCETAPQACCDPFNGLCENMDPVLCAAIDRTPQGSGTACTDPDACCLPDGTCAMIDPQCCDDLGGVAQGPFSECTVLQACCLGGGLCNDLDPLCCVERGGTPQGPGTGCVDMVRACCLPAVQDPDCVNVDPVCCNDIGGVPSPMGEPMCLGDVNGNGQDDACEQVCRPNADATACEGPCLVAPQECLPKRIVHHVPPPNFPLAGLDVMAPTSGYVDIRYPDGHVERSYIDPGISPNVTRIQRGDPACVGGHRTVEAEIIETELVALGPGGMHVLIHENPALASSGNVVAQPAGCAGDYPADSFFDIFVTMDVPGMGIYGIWNPAPIPMEAAAMMSVPPYGTTYHSVPGWPGVMLLDVFGQPTGLMIVEAEHEMPGEWEILECACTGPDVCHVERIPGNDPYCVGGCPPPPGGEECIMRIAMMDPATTEYACECGPSMACCLADGTCLEVDHSTCVAQGGDPQGPGTICDLRVCALLKWSQPPVFEPASPHPECFWGWDELSRYAGQQIVADDWLCDDTRPVKDLHWWGSYVDWEGIDPPAIAPSEFHIGLWTDMPSPPEPFSHPGFMIAEWVVPRADLNERPVACDFHPAFMLTPDGCFRYDFEIPYGQWFYQEPACNIYWLSVSARYTLPVEPPFPWGWKTRPHFFMDDAVRIFVPTAPLLGMPFMIGEPMEMPFGVSWDMAFVLTTCETKPYGDIAAPWDVVDVDDILRVLSGFMNPELIPEADIWTCGGDGVIDVDDIMAVLDAFSGTPWCPEPCR